jgi:RimJ/RimL family protein N-acetyltransferase
MTTGPCDLAPMSADDAIALEAAMAAEAPGDLAHFTAFRPPGGLRDQLARARRDRFVTLRDAGRAVGFYCLRGLDAGYERPAFGVYVARSHRGRGLAGRALADALAWAAAAGIARVMLKVAAANHAARRVYDAAGFVPVGLCPDSGQTVMERVLAPPDGSDS